jgi:putative aldouronate transport system permease protein
MSRVLSTADKAVTTAIGAVLGVIVLLMIYPFSYVVFASLSDPMLVATHPILLYPRRPNLDAFRFLFSVSTVWIGYYNTIVYTMLGTALNITVTMLAAHSLAHPDFRGRRVILFFVVLTMYFSGGMIPLFLVVRALGMLNKRIAVIVPVAVSTWNLLIARSYLLANIPRELRDAADVDGAGELVVFSRVVLPLSQPVIAVLLLFYATGHWNAFFNALIYLRNRNLYPLQVFLRELLLLETQMDAMLDDSVADRAFLVLTLKYAIMVAAIVPMLVIFPFVQRYFVKGVMIGALKG